MDNKNLFLAQITDMANWVKKNRSQKNTNFLDLSKQALARDVLKDFPDIKFSFLGGYKGAERKIAIIYPSFLSETDLDVPLAALRITGAFDEKTLSHRDFLGSLIGLGISREKIGDILIASNLCQVLVMDDIKPYILNSLFKVGKFNVSIEEMDLEDLILPEKRVKEIKTTVSALRLDAVASSAFGMSRSKVLPYIRGERVQVNWKTITKPAYTLNSGDVISIRGRGRAVLKEINGKSQKGRIKILVLRYL